MFAKQREAAYASDSDGRSPDGNELCHEFYDDFDKWYEKAWDELKFENGIREFFSGKPEFGDILIKWWNDGKSNSEQHKFPDVAVYLVKNRIKTCCL